MPDIRGQFRASAGLLPDPEPHPRTYTVISVDDHLIEPAHTFEGRVPARFAGRIPRIVESDDGGEVWEWEGSRYPQIAIGATVGRPKDEWSLAATRFSDIRPGCYDPAARVRDMDLDGVYASLNFASLIAGFAGGLFYRGTDEPELGQCLVRAWNDWQYEEWISAYPDRFIGSGISWLGDPKIAAEEVRRNAARGFKALSFLENPADYGLPSLYTDHWDPLFEACEETETVLCLHVGSSGWKPAGDGSPFEVSALLFPLGAARAAIEWLWSGIPVRFPRLAIALSEGGCGWVPMMMDRIEYVMGHSGAASGEGWRWAQHPNEVLLRSFNFCAVEFGNIPRFSESVGIDNLMIECDYPHSDSTWPDTQPLLEKALTGFAPADIRKVTWENAARLYRHPVPSALQLPQIDPS